MKKLLVLIALVFVLAACMPEFPPAESQAPQESSTTFVVTERKGEFLLSQNGAPRGSYILIRYNSSGPINGQRIFVDLVFNDNTVCTWDLASTQPWDRGEEVLYFAPIQDNCIEMDSRNGVKWYVIQNWAELSFEGKIIQEIPVWTTTGSSFSLLEDKR